MTQPYLAGTKFSTKFSTDTRTAVLLYEVTRRLEKQRRAGAAKPLDPGDTGRRYSS
eukprot:SAG31_NODE_15385_length_757_cov_4.053191_1_plen_55_part_10